MIPLPWMLGGGAVMALAALAGGYKLGSDHVQGRWDAEALERSRSALVYIERNLERQAAQEQAAQARQAVLAKNLMGARRANREAMQQALQCPASGRLGDVVFHGLAERLRDARAQRRAGAAAAAASVPAR